MHLYSKVRRGSQFSLTKLQESAEASASLKAELLGLFAAGTLPAMIRCDEYDVSAAHEAMKMCVFLYGRQPHAGYRQGAGREVDDAAARDLCRQHVLSDGVAEVLQRGRARERKECVRDTAAITKRAGPAERRPG